MAKKKSAVERKATNTPEKKMRTNHLLIIGIDHYSNGINQLNNAVRDAQMFKDLMVEKFQFSEAHITELYNQEATRSRILQTFGQLLNQLTDEDNLIFYYSGHGEQREVGTGELGYWIPSDATLNQSWTYIPNAEIINLFKLSKAHHIFGIVDSCFSGSLFRTRKLSTAEERIDSYKSRWLLTAGRLELVSDGSLGKNSPFATTLFDYLNDNPDKAIWVADLCHWVIKGMEYDTEKQTPRGEPLLGVGHRGGQLILVKKGYQLFIEDTEIASQPTTNPPTREPVKERNQVTNTPTTLTELKHHLKEALLLDLGTGIDTFQSYFNRDSKRYNDFIMQASQYNSVNNQLTAGTITNAETKPTFNKVRYHLLDFIDELEEEDVVL